jgi:hypothetical protein
MGSYQGYQEIRKLAHWSRVDALLRCKFHLDDRHAVLKLRDLQLFCEEQYKKQYHRELKKIC